MNLKQFQNEIETCLKDALEKFPNWQYLTRKDVLLLFVLGLIMFLGM